MRSAISDASPALNHAGGRKAMDYAFYPGCSLDTVAREYRESIEAVFTRLGVGLTELADWNCCGATALPSTHPLTSRVIAARNLALVGEEAGVRGLAVACSGCLVALRRAQEALEAGDDVSEKMAAALNSIGRSPRSHVRMRHILEILVADVGLEKLRSSTSRPLSDLRVVCYYGCQIARPRNDFAPPELPTAMDELMAAVGAEVLRYDNKTRCCGAALISTKKPVALRLIRELLDEARERHADAMVVLCPMCQLNLDAYQEELRRGSEASYRLPVLYFTQLAGIALGIPAGRLGLRRTMVSPAKLLRDRLGVAI
ncbi:MAG: CoB--CoM heterodisulfide reductase iron-sulfur subunit B family protein [Acetobacteraceae bacterium]|nr:CoB--CoM heterodisulfide reductase iron-sulfur subunit B family protein [Acetobacteraceae bacterium]